MNMFDGDGRVHERDRRGVQRVRRRRPGGRHPDDRLLVALPRRSAAVPARSRHSPRPRWSPARAGPPRRRPATTRSSPSWTATAASSACASRAGSSPRSPATRHLLVFAIDGAVSQGPHRGVLRQQPGPAHLAHHPVHQPVHHHRARGERRTRTSPTRTRRSAGRGSSPRSGSKGHFPPNVAEHPAGGPVRDRAHQPRRHVPRPAPDGIKGTADDVHAGRAVQHRPGVRAGRAGAHRRRTRTGSQSGLLPAAQNRGIATLPGGIPIFKNGQVVGGIGVFFPGKTGFATEENSAPRARRTTRPSRTGRWKRSGSRSRPLAGRGGGRHRQRCSRSATLGGVRAAGRVRPARRPHRPGRHPLDVFGPGGAVQRADAAPAGRQHGRPRQPDDGRTARSTPVPTASGTGDDVLLRRGLPVPEGWLVVPHDGVGITAGRGEPRSSPTGSPRRTGRGPPSACRSAAGRCGWCSPSPTGPGNIVGLYRDAGRDGLLDRRGGGEGAERGLLRRPGQAPADRPGAGRAAGVRRSPTGRSASSACRGSRRAIDGAAGPVLAAQRRPGGTNRVHRPAASGPAAGVRVPERARVRRVQPAARTSTTRPTCSTRTASCSSPAARRCTGRGAGADRRVRGVSGDGVDQDDVVTTAGQVGLRRPFGASRADQMFVRRGAAAVPEVQPQPGSVLSEA